MLLFKRLSLLATASVYFLIFVGGLVRVSGAGLGCPDWPRCFGRWIPPVSLSQLPVDMDPAQFNFTLAWIEYSNRLIGMVVGFLVLLVAILAWRFCRHRARILWPAVAAALLTGFQGWLGGMVVTTELAPLLVSLHMLLALIIASLLIWVTHQSHVTTDTVPASSGRAGTRSLWLFALWAMSVVQLVLGTQVREALEVAARQFPLFTDTQLLEQIGATGIWHGRVGSALIVLSVLTAIMMLRRRAELPPLAVGAAWVILSLSVLEGLLGTLLWSYRLHPVMQVLHLWVASLYASILLIALLALRYGPAESRSTAGSVLPRLLAPVAGALVMLGLVASLVVHRAESARRALPVLGQVPEFSFTDQTGRAWGSKQLEGKITVVYFGFASCQGPCPIMNAHIAELYALYAPSERVQFAQISVDPQRDSVAALAAFAQSLGVRDRRWVFLHAPLERVVWLSESGFMMAAENLPGGHSIKLVLTDERGRIRGYYDGRDADAISLLRMHIRELARSPV